MQMQRKTNPWKKKTIGASLNWGQQMHEQRVRNRSSRKERGQKKEGKVRRWLEENSKGRRKGIPSQRRGKKRIY